MIKEIIQQYNRYIPPDVKIVERNGYIFFIHPFKRFDPVITPLAIGAMVAGTGMEIAGTLKEGKQAEKISKQRAAIDIQNAEAVRRASVEKAKIKSEQGRKLLATQKAQAAAGGIRINVGSPLVIETQTRADIATDIGYILERGRTESDYYRSSAAIEIATGKAARKKAKSSAWAQGIKGFGSIAYMGVESGMFGGTQQGLTTSGTAIKGMPSGRHGMGW